MALILCRECGKYFSERAAACPHCGCPAATPAQPAGEAETAKTNTRHGRSVWRWLAPVMVVGLLLLTCPGEAAHKQRISSMWRDFVQDEAETRNSEAWAVGLATLFGGLFIDHAVTVDSYGIFSLGRVALGKETHTVTLGVLGQVFPLGNPRKAADRLTPKEEEESATDFFKHNP